MITQRFQPVMWVVGVAVAATALYTVSLRVASERARLDELDKKIADTRREIRQLQTELGTRGSLRQLERWNGEALSLVAPHANQFLATENALVKVDGAKLTSGSQYVPAPVLVATTSTPAEEEAQATEPKMLAKPGPDEQAAQEAKIKSDRVALLDRTLGSPKADGAAKGEKDVAKP